MTNRIHRSVQSTNAIHLCSEVALSRTWVHAANGSVETDSTRDIHPGSTGWSTSRIGLRSGRPVHVVMFQVLGHGTLLMQKVSLRSDIAPLSFILLVMPAITPSSVLAARKTSKLCGVHFSD